MHLQECKMRSVTFLVITLLYKNNIFHVQIFKFQIIMTQFLKNAFAEILCNYPFFPRNKGDEPLLACTPVQTSITLLGIASLKQ